MTDAVSDALGAALLQIAREALELHFRRLRAPHPLPDLPELARPGASFVTLTQSGRLRGCIGSLEAWRTLASDVRENALSAALRDPRFSPLRAGELARTRIEVSRLSPPQPLPCRSEEELRARLTPGVDGVILRAGRQCATFLPQVWEQLPDPEAFIAHLRQKAGLPLRHPIWEERIEIYRVDSWQEAPPAP